MNNKIEDFELTSDIELIEDFEITKDFNLKIKKITPKYNFNDYFIFLFNLFIRPSSTIQKIEHNFDKFLFSLTNSFIFIIITSILRIFNIIFNIVVYKNYDLIDDCEKYIIDFNKLNNLPLIRIFIDTIIATSLIIFVITVTYYTISLIQNKIISLSKLIIISSISLIPIIIFSMLILPIFFFINENLNIYIFIIGIIFSSLILISETNKIIQLNADKFIINNLIALIIIFFISNIIINDLIIYINDYTFYFIN